MCGELGLGDNQQKRNPIPLPFFDLQAKSAVAQVASGNQFTIFLLGMIHPPLYYVKLHDYEFIIFIILFCCCFRSQKMAMCMELAKMTSGN